jgi:hypothetical protein
VRHEVCSAASTTLVMSIARVIGPTPPGMGATKPATSRTSGWTSPTSPASVRVMPTSEKWAGMTYPEDKKLVADYLQGLVDKRVYPHPLF